MQAVWQWFWYLLPANPIFVRILQGGSRRTRHLLTRIGYLGLMIVIMIAGLLFGGGFGAAKSLTELAKSGATVFQFISYSQVILICLLAPLFMAGAIAAEQSGQTYNILITTPLTNLQIVLGSLCGRLFFILALLLSGLPLFSIVQIFGGVPIVSVFVAFGVAGLSAIMVGSVAITLAVLRIGGRKAVFGFVISIVAYLVGGYAIDSMLRPQLQVGVDTTTWLTPLHPMLVLQASLGSVTYRTPSPEAVGAFPVPIRFYLSQPFATFTILTLLLSSLLVGWSSLRLRAVGTRDMGASALPPWMRKWLRLGAPGLEKQRRGRDVWNNPVAWREANTRGNRAAAILGRFAFAACGVAATGVILALYHFGKLGAATFLDLLTAFLLIELAIIIFVGIYMSAGAVSREREDGTLDLMLTTPITPRQYVWGKLRGLVSFLSLLIAVPILSTAMVSLYTLIGTMAGWPTAQFTHAQAGGTGTIRDDLILLEAPILMAIMLVPFVAVCVMVGMQWSIKSRGVLGAVIVSIIILGAFMLITGFCGFSAAENIPVVGAVINCFSPTTNVLMILDPWARVDHFTASTASGRVVLFMGACIAAGGYSVVVYAMLGGIVRTFDQTVRKLSGAGA